MEVLVTRFVDLKTYSTNKIILSNVWRSQLLLDLLIYRLDDFIFCIDIVAMINIESFISDLLLVSLSN